MDKVENLLITKREIEETLEQLKTVLNSGEGYGYDLVTQIESEEIKLECVMKRIPKKPNMRCARTWTCPPDCGGEENDEYGDVPYCPICGKELENHPNFCPNCGQALEMENK